jgi:predicted anti-sigma-YlaC factor YlaD
VSDCLRPLDPIDAEALASGAEPPFAPDAAGHATACPACGAAVERAARLTRELEGLSQKEESPFPDLATRVIRLRDFSRRERRTYALWRAPVLLAGGLAAGGFALVLAPSLSGSDQAGLGAALLVPTLAIVRAVARWVPELLRVAPTGLEALSEAFRAERGLGLAALLLLMPAAAGFRWVLSRERSRR